MPWPRIETFTPTRDVDLKQFRTANHIPSTPTLNPTSLTKSSLLWFHEHRVVFVGGNYAFFGGESSTKAPSIEVRMQFYLLYIPIVVSQVITPFPW